MSALELSGVGKTFKKKKVIVEALNDVSLSIGEGEVFGFIGPNGAGKSTTIKVILNIISDYVGDVRIFGRSARDPQARRGVGYVPESPALYEQLTPLETLQAGLALHGIRRSSTDRWCMQWLERLSIGHVAKRPLRELSKGTVQRVALAHALAVEPRLLILDEPLSGLDPLGRHDVVDILQDYHRQGGTIFVTSHVLHDVERLAARFGVIHRGRLRAVSSPADLVDTDHLVTVRSNGQAAVPGFVCESPGRWTGEVPNQDLWACLAGLRDAGHEIFEIRPSLTLEKAVMKFLKGDAHAGSNFADAATELPDK